MILKKILHRDGMVYITIAAGTNLAHTEDIRISASGWRVYSEKYSTNEGVEIGESEYDMLHELSERTEAVLSAARILSGGDKSERELTLKLRRDYSEKAAAYAVRLMKKRGYLNEEEQCRRIAEDAVKHKHHGALRIKSDLISHGYGAKAASDAVHMIPDEDYAAALRYCIDKKYPDIGNADSSEIKKAVSALMRLGFSSGEIFDEIKRVGR